MRIGRRRAIGSMLGGLSLAACSARVGPRSSEPVIVVGAGAAGLAAADALRRLGRAVIVLEARDRVGGRVHREAGLELGAELVHGAEASSWPLLRRAGVRADRMRLELEARAGRLTRIEGLEGLDVERVHAALRRAPVASAQAVLSSLGHGPESSVTRRLTLDLDLERQSASALGELLEDPARTSGDFIVRGGYGRMLEPLAQGLEVRLGHVVRAIRVGRDGVRLECARGEIVRGAAAIVTLPIGVLRARRVAFEPPLPSEVEDAIERLGVVDAVKLFYRFDDAIWPDGADVLRTEGPGPRVFWSSTPARRGSEHVVCGWATHALARSLLEGGERDALRRGLASLRASLGASVPEPRSARWAEWSRDGLSLGAYSFTPVGAHGARSALTAPIHDRLWLAGEATGADGSERAAFTVHGALESGWRAAASLDATLG